MSENSTSNLDRAMALARRLIEAENSAPVSAPVAQELRNAHDLKLREEGRTLEEVLRNLEQVLIATPMSSSRRFFNLLFGGRDDVATIAEVASAIANTTMHTFKVAGPQMLVEQEVISRMTQKVEYRDGDGIFTPGGSLANLAGLILARNSAFEQARNHGLDGRRTAVYTSSDSHYSIRKNLGIIGIGRNNQRTVPVDRRGRMRVDRLRDMIREDLDRGVRPIMVNATAGTTVLGAFDPIDKIAAVCEEFGIWLHVDGSLGASVLFCAEHRHLMKGVERSDSLSWCAHKMIGVPLSCSAILVKNKGDLEASFGETADYLFQGDSETEALDFGTKSIQCGRRNDALKLWTTWQHLGDRGIAQRIRHLFALTHRAVEIIESHPRLELVDSPQSINVCFRVIGASSVAICERLAADELAMVGHALVGDQRIIRLVCVNATLSVEDIDSFFRSLEIAIQHCTRPATEDRRVQC